MTSYATNKSRGFTLIEILIALLITAVALGAAIRASGLLVRDESELRKKMMASWSAENRIIEIQLENRAHRLSVGNRKYMCSQGIENFQCSETIQATSYDGVVRVVVEVADAVTQKKYAYAASMVDKNAN